MRVRVPFTPDHVPPGGSIPLRTGAEPNPISHGGLARINKKNLLARIGAWLSGAVCHCSCRTRESAGGLREPNRNQRSEGTNLVFPTGRSPLCLLAGGITLCFPIGKCQSCFLSGRKWPSSLPRRRWICPGCGTISCHSSFRVRRSDKLGLVRWLDRLGNAERRSANCERPSQVQRCWTNPSPVRLRTENFQGCPRRPSQRCCRPRSPEKRPKCQLEQKKRGPPAI